MLTSKDYFKGIPSCKARDSKNLNTGEHSFICHPTQYSFFPVSHYKGSVVEKISRFPRSVIQGQKKGSNKDGSKIKDSVTPLC